MESGLHRPSLSLLTDLYQLTMANGYWKNNRMYDEAVFHHFFRKHPFGGGYTVSAGLAYAVDYLNSYSFTDDDREYLRSLTGNDNQPLFDDSFLEYIGEMELSVDVDAIPEGTVVFPHEPLLRLKGSLIQCQLLETALLNIVNFQTLIATKAARVCQAARGDPVLEFGLRRAQGIDGAIAASRAAYIGGCGGTSNVLAGRLHAIPVKGTHAHSWVLAFDDEIEAFEAYARAMPNNCVFLVDTFDTLDGVKNAIGTARKLRELGRELIGIRLDSGDLAYLSIEARKLLNDAGFDDAVIIASNDLDEHIIEMLKRQGAKIDIWGVGTRLVSGYDDPALGGVYKLAAVRRPRQEWRYKVKLSDESTKSTTPGILQVRRFADENGFAGDMIYNEETGGPGSTTIVGLANGDREMEITDDMHHEDLLVPIFRKGKFVGTEDPLEAVRKRRARQLDGLHPDIKLLVNPRTYPSGLDADLHRFKMDMIDSLRRRRQED